MRAIASPVLARRSLAARRRWRWEEIVFWVAVAVGSLLLPGYLLLITQLLIMGLFALSLDLLQGYTGIPSLGHAAFFGIGAYTAGLLAKAGWGDPISGLAAAALTAAAFGFLCSLLVARLSGIALLTVTLGIGLLLYEVAHRLRSLTGGDDGLQGIEMAPVLGYFPFDIYGRTALFYAIAVTLALYLAARHLVHSPFGLSLEAVRENPRRADAIGISVRQRLRAIFTISAAIAGVAGALLTQTNQFVAVDVFSLERSVAALVIVVLGGAGTLIGAMIGAAVFEIGRDFLSAINPAYWTFWLGLILFGIVLVGSGGVVGGMRRIGRQLGSSARVRA